MIPMTIVSAMESLAAEITAAGVRAVLDERDLSVPGALVELTRVDPDTVLCGTPTVSVEIWLVAPDNGRVQSLETLTAQYQQIEHLTAGGFTPAAFSIGGNMYPALKSDPIQLEEH